jgi:uncharacterized protein GlcG (DUF336 family)
MDAAMNEAVKNNYGVAIAVADECGKLLCLKRMAHVPPVYSSVAEKKAHTCVIIRRSTALAEEVAKVKPYAMTDDIFPGKGGLPIFHNGECIGGIGVSGAKPDPDEIVARAGLSAIKELDDISTHPTYASASPTRS